MSKKFDAESYANRWEPIIIPAMLILIVVSLGLVVMLNVKSRPSCLRHEMIFCGSESQANYDAAKHHGAEGHGGAAGHETHQP